MIAVIGRVDAGPAVEVARRAAAAGATVELVATAPVGRVGDAAVARLAGARIGHAAVLRSPATGLEPADLDLALRYLPDVTVVVLADPSPGLRGPAEEAAAWSGAALVVIAEPAPSDAGSGEAGSAEAGASSDRHAEAAAFVLERPARDPDGAFLGVVAELAARLDRGESGVVAWSGTTDRLALERVARARVRDTEAAVSDRVAGASD